jgi:hypothetical protein
MSVSTERNEKTDYHDISFQGKTGSLTLRSDKMIFRPKCKCDPSASSLSWLWPSIKKIQVLVDDTKVKKSFLKISNHSSKAVLFLVPEHVVHKLQQDISSRVAAAQDLKKPDGGTGGKRKVARCKSADYATNHPFQLAREVKVRGEEATSDAAALEKDKQVSTKTAFTRPKVQGNKSDTCGARPCNGGSQKVTSLRSSAREASRPGEVTPFHATKVIAKDSFIKPSQQAIHDYCVSRANNLIVQPVTRNIIDPAHAKIIQPIQGKAKAMIVKPANEMIVKPSQQVVKKLLLPPKIIAQDMGILSRHEPVADGEAERAGDGNLILSSRHKRYSFMHFLKAPLRRTVSEDRGKSTRANRSAKTMSSDNVGAAEKGVIVSDDSGEGILMGVGATAA